MKNAWIIWLIAFSAGLFAYIPVSDAQNGAGSHISYRVVFGPVFPIEGESSVVNGTLSLNDTTGALEKISFEAPLNSFTGQHADYLAWVGSSWTYPDLKFESSSLTQKGDEWVAKGMLEFRDRNMPLSIRFVRSDTEAEATFHATFNLPARDYFVITPPLDLVPASIPMEVSLVFEKPLLPEAG